MDNLALVEHETIHGLFATGEPVSFRYLRNTERSPFFGAQFGQDVEPHGTYLTEDTADGYLHPLPSYEYGWAHLRSPLVLVSTLDPDALYGPTGWKARLHTAYGKKGKALTRALRRDGYDGVVTVHTYQLSSGQVMRDTTEIVDLTFGGALEADIEATGPRPNEAEGNPPDGSAIWYHGTSEPWEEDDRPVYLTSTRSLAAMHARGPHAAVLVFEVDDDAVWADISGSWASMDSIGYQLDVWARYLAEGVQVLWDEADYAAGYTQIFVIDPSVLTLVEEEQT